MGLLSMGSAYRRMAPGFLMGSLDTRIASAGGGASYMGRQEPHVQAGVGFACVWAVPPTSVGQPVATAGGGDTITAVSMCSSTSFLRRCPPSVQRDAGAVPVAHTPHTPGAATHHKRTERAHHHRSGSGQPHCRLLQGATEAARLRDPRRDN